MLQTYKDHATHCDSSVLQTYKVLSKLSKSFNLNDYLIKTCFVIFIDKLGKFIAAKATKERIKKYKAAYLQRFVKLLVTHDCSKFVVMRQ